MTLFRRTCDCAAAPMVMHVQYIVTCSFIFFIKSTLTVTFQNVLTDDNDNTKLNKGNSALSVSSFSQKF